MANHRIQDIGFLEESTFGTSDIAFGSPYYQIGLNLSDFTLPNLKEEVLPTYDGSSRDPSQIEITRQYVEGLYPFEYVDAWPWYFFMANTDDGVTESPAGTFTLDGAFTKDTAPFSVKYETSDGTTRIQKEATGCRAHTLISSIDFERGSNLLGSLGYNGQQLQTKSFTSRQAPIFPDGNAANKDVYRYVGSGSDATVVTWDVGGDDVPITQYMRNFTHTGRNTNFEMVFPHGTSYPTFIRTGNKRAWAISFDMLKSDKTDVFDDFLSQEANDTFKDMRFKIYNSSSKYQQWDFTDVALSEVKQDYRNENANNETTFQVVGFPKSATLTTIDGTVSARWGL